MQRQLCFAPEVLHVRPWPDDVIDHLGHDPRSTYVEDYWLSFLAPQQPGFYAGWRPVLNTAPKASISTWLRQPVLLGLGTEAAAIPPSYGRSTGPSSLG